MGVLREINVWEFEDGPLASFIGRIEKKSILTIIFSHNSQVRSITVQVDKIVKNDVKSSPVLISPRQLSCTGNHEPNVIVETDGKLSRLQLNDRSTIPEVDIYRVENIPPDMSTSTWIEWCVIYTVNSQRKDIRYRWFVFAPNSSIAKYRAERQLLSKYSAVKIKNVIKSDRV